jgi:hypothetical protein
MTRNQLYTCPVMMVASSPLQECDDINTSKVSKMLHVRRRLKIRWLGAAVLATVTPLSHGFTQFLPSPAAPVATSLRYADLADLFAGAPIVLRAKIASATRLKDASTLAGATRFFVEADVTALIRGTGGLPPRVKYLVDVLPDSRGRLPKLKKADVLIAALPVAGRPSEIQLAARDAQMIWTPALDTRVRRIVADVLTPGAAPEVTGIASAFHVAGSVPGEGETQIFLSTATGAPVSVSVLRRPGEAPRWALALGEIVDDAAAVPARDTLPWYRLACFLPRDLPERAARELSTSDADAARADYAVVINGLGPCDRVRR